MENHIKVREAQLKDAPIIADFQVKMAWETEEFALQPDVVLKGVTAAIEDPLKGDFFVAFDENTDEIVGCLFRTYEWSDWRNGCTWWIQSLYVVPEYRKKGVFKTLYHFLKEIVDSRPDITGLRLYVDKRNIRAQKVYDAIGMTSEHYITYEWMKD